MNGVRSTFMRRGYLLTALSALLLLAASVGTASAQPTGITITGPPNGTVTEGGTATYTVAINGFIAAAADADSPVAPATATVTLTLNTPGTGSATASEPGDVSTNEGLAVNFNVPSNNRLTAVRFRQSQQIRVRTNPDSDAENEVVGLTFELTNHGELDTTAVGGTDISVPPAAAGTPTMLTIDDDEDQTYVLALSPATQKPAEGTPVTVSLRASPPHEDGSGRLTLGIDKRTPGWSLTDGNDAAIEGPVSVGSAQATTGVAIKVVNPGNDRNRVADTVTLTAHSGVAGASNLEDSLTITLADVNALPAVTAKVVDMDGEVLDPQPTSVEEGETVKIAVMPLNKDGKVAGFGAEKLTVTLAPSGSADSRDYRPLGKIEIDAGNPASNSVDLIIENDEDVGMEMLVFDATVSGAPGNGTETGTTAGVLSLGIEDATTKKIWTKSQDDAYPKITAAIEEGAGDEGLNPGESFTINTSDLFGYAEGYSASFSAASDSEAVSVSASGSTVTAMAESAGSAKVTITGTARMASSSFKAEQTISNVADVTFEVTVVDKMLMLTLDAPGAMEGNVVEGMDYDVTVTANRAVHEDTEVMFMRSDMSEADVRDYSIEGVTIMAGEMMATATLMVTEDMEDDAGHAMGEALHLYAMAGDAKSNTLELMIWDEAVPALPLIGQLLLALFLMAGGARLYRRRQS